MRFVMNKARPHFCPERGGLQSISRSVCTLLVGTARCAVQSRVQRRNDSSPSRRHTTLVSPAATGPATTAALRQLALYFRLLTLI